MSKSNAEIIALEASKKNFSYNGNNLYTYVQWVQMGYVVVRGQRAYIKTRLWSQGKNKRLVPASLFRVEQVTKVNQDQLIVV